MPFELETPTKAKVLGVFVLSQKNRQPDEDPGAKLTLSMLVSNDVLSTIDGTMKGWLFMRANGQRQAEKQATLDGVEVISDMPDLTNAGKHIKTLPWVDELTGYHLAIDHGTGGRSDIGIDDCKLSNFKIQPQSGGTVKLKLDLESPNVSEKLWGKLAKMKAREIEIILIAPDIDTAQRSIEDDGPWPFKKGGASSERPPQSVTIEAPEKAARKGKGEAATDAFLAVHGNPVQ